MVKNSLCQPCEAANSGCCEVISLGLIRICFNSWNNHFFASAYGSISAFSNLDDIESTAERAERYFPVCLLRVYIHGVEQFDWRSEPSTQKCFWRYLWSFLSHQLYINHSARTKSANGLFVLVCLT